MAAMESSPEAISLKMLRTKSSGFAEEMLRTVAAVDEVELRKKSLPIISAGSETRTRPGDNASPSKASLALMRKKSISAEDISPVGLNGLATNLRISGSYTDISTATAPVKKAPRKPKSIEPIDSDPDSRKSSLSVPSVEDINRRYRTRQRKMSASSEPENTEGSPTNSRTTASPPDGENGIIRDPTPTKRRTRKPSGSSENAPNLSDSSSSSVRKMSSPTPNEENGITKSKPRSRKPSASGENNDDAVPRNLSASASVDDNISTDGGERRRSRRPSAADSSASAATAAAAVSPPVKSMPIADPVKKQPELTTEKTPAPAAVASSSSATVARNPSKRLQQLVLKAMDAKEMEKTGRMRTLSDPAKEPGDLGRGMRTASALSEGEEPSPSLPALSPLRLALLRRQTERDLFAASDPNDPSGGMEMSSTRINMQLEGGTQRPMYTRNSRQLADIVLGLISNRQQTPAASSTPRENTSPFGTTNSAGPNAPFASQTSSNGMNSSLSPSGATSPAGNTSSAATPGGLMMAQAPSFTSAVVASAGQTAMAAAGVGSLDVADDSDDEADTKGGTINLNSFMPTTETKSVRPSAISSLLINEEGPRQTFVREMNRLLNRFYHPFKESPLTTWRLKFPGPLEVLYLNFYFNQDLRTLRLVILTMIFALIVSIILLVTIRGRDCAPICTADIYAIIQSAMVLGLIPTLSCLYYVRLVKNRFRLVSIYVGIMICIVLIVSGTTHYIDSALSNQALDSGVYYEFLNPGVFLFCLLLYCAFPLPFDVAFWIAMTFTVVEIILEIAAAASGIIKFTAPEIIANIILYVLANLICVFASYVKDNFFREFFLKARESQERQMKLAGVREQSEIILHSILPSSILKELKATSANHNGMRKLVVQEHDNVTILFADIAGFTAFSATVSAEFLVDFLNDLFMRFDNLAETYGVEKIKTLGDCYMACGGVPDPLPDHAQRVCLMALEMAELMQNGLNLHDTSDDKDAASKKKALKMRIGVHSGKVVAGVIGVRKFKYDVWSDDVNFASFMEQSGIPGQVHISEATFEYVKNDVMFSFSPGEMAERSNGTKMATYFVKRFTANLEAIDNAATVSRGVKKKSPKRRAPELTLASIMASSANLFPNDQPSPVHPSIMVTEGGDNSNESISNNSSRLEASPSKTISPPFSPLRSKASRKKKLEKVNSISSLPKTSSTSLPGAAGRTDGSSPVAALAAFQNRSVSVISTSIFNPAQRQEQEEKIMFKIRQQLNWSGSFVDPTLESEFRLTYTRYATDSAMPMSFMLFIIGMILLVVHILVFTDDWIPLVVQAATLLIVLSVIIFMRNDKRFMVEVRRPPDGYPVDRFGKQLPAPSTMIVSTLDPHWLILPILWVIYAGLMIEFSGQALGLSANGLLSVYIFGCMTVMLTINVACVGLRSLVFNVSSVVMLIIYYIVYFVVATQTSTSYDFLMSLVVDQFTFYLLLCFMLAFVFNLQMDIVTRRHYLMQVSLEKKTKETKRIQQESEHLLSNILPEAIAARLLKNPNSSIADPYNEVAIIFCTIANFKGFEELHPTDVVRVLNEIMSDIDEACDKFGVEKIKTIGPTYMAMCGGLPSKVAGHPLIRMAQFALHLREIIAKNNETFKLNFEIRIGLNIGPVVTGVIGTQKFAFDVWGDTVNTASRMDYTGTPGRIQVTKAVRKNLRRYFEFEERGVIYVKGKGKMRTYFMNREYETPLPDPATQAPEEQPNDASSVTSKRSDGRKRTFTKEGKKKPFGTIERQQTALNGLDSSRKSTSPKRKSAPPLSRPKVKKQGSQIRLKIELVPKIDDIEDV